MCGPSFVTRPDTDNCQQPWYTAKLVWLCALVETATCVLLGFCNTDEAIKEKSLTSRGGKEG